MSDKLGTLPTAGKDPTAAPARHPRRAAAVWSEIKGMALVLLAVLAFHSFIAKPFYIPSESMMPVLLKGDRLVVSKYPYGWSWISPSFHVLPRWPGRLLGRMPERGDIVIVTPPGQTDDYIKRVIGLPGDTVAVRGGRLHLNGRMVPASVQPPAMVPIDQNAPCGIEFAGFRVETPDGKRYCRLPVIRETLPDGPSFDTIDLGPSPGDDFGPVRVPAGHLFLMGDNRDRSADSRFSLGAPENGLGGSVPWENIGGRAEFITFSLDGSTRLLNPLSWFRALRSERAGASLRPARY